LGLGRLFAMTPRITFHPSFGLRGSWQYQKSHLSSDLLTGNFDQKIKGSEWNDFWGVGPRFGTHFSYSFESHFSFLANFAAALLAGRQKLRINDTLTSTTTGSPSSITKNKSRDSLSIIRANIEGMVGLGWERWLRNQSVRIAPSVAFEGSLWFAMNQLYSSLSNINNRGTRRNGNLGLMGITFDLQVDF
jgi:hypothetical protein